MHKTICCAAILCTLLPATAAAATKSLFVQVVSVPRGAEAYKTRTWFKKVCDDFKEPGSDDYIFNIVLSEIADELGNLDEDGLDIVEDYYGCFDNVFVGTVNLSHPDPYVAGMKDEDFRWANINLSAEVAAAYDARFSAAFPNETFAWYISYEANLNYFPADVALQNAYEAFIIELSNQLTAIRPGAVLWSPATWTPYTSLSSGQRAALQTGLADLLSNTPKLTWLHFQDFLGQAASRNCDTGQITYGFGAADAIGYYGLLQAAAGSNLDSLRVNMEHFVLGGTGCPQGSIYPGDPAEHLARETAYANAGVPIGASWEIRWWYLSLFGEPDQTCDAVEVCDGVDNDCDLKVDEEDVCGGTTTGEDTGADTAGTTQGTGVTSTTVATTDAGDTTTGVGGTLGDASDTATQDEPGGGCACRGATPRLSWMLLPPLCAFVRQRRCRRGPARNRVQPESQGPARVARSSPICAPREAALHQPRDSSASSPGHRVRDPFGARGPGRSMRPTAAQEVFATVDDCVDGLALVVVPVALGEALRCGSIAGVTSMRRIKPA